MNPTYDFKDQVAFVTGAAMGMGLAAACGASVVSLAFVGKDIPWEELAMNAIWPAVAIACAIGVTPACAQSGAAAGNGSGASAGAAASTAGGGGTLSSGSASNSPSTDTSGPDYPIENAGVGSPATTVRSGQGSNNSGYPSAQSHPPDNGEERP